VTLKGPAPHPLVPLFEEFLFQNLPISFGSSFSVHLCKTDFRVGDKNELPKFTAVFFCEATISRYL